MSKRMMKIMEKLCQQMEKPVIEDGLVLKAGHGHTIETAHLSKFHAGRDTASAFVLGKVTGSISQGEGLKMLDAISQLQITDSESDMYGAFRWYLEETRPNDTNAAFFTLAPLAIIKLFYPECLSESEAYLIDNMLNHSFHWFSKECKNAILFYTNKIVNDGALLTAISKFTGNDDHKKQSRDFLNKWLNYTEKRGFGWGENLSITYNTVTLQGFAIIKKALDENYEDNSIKLRFEKIENEILDIFRFNNGYEFVPAIRSYNVDGFTQVPSYIYNIAQVEGFGVLDGFGVACNIQHPDYLSNLIIAVLLFDERLYLDKEDYVNKKYSNVMKTPRTRITRIMDDKTAYSWIGKNGGLGSINRFPVIEGSYQHKTWGLGWQSFPVNIAVYQKQVSFLRFYVDDGKRIRCHPHKDKRISYLDPALFSENYYPEVMTACKQKDNTLITIRKMAKLRNKVKSISDSLDIQRFDGKVLEFNIQNRHWVVLSYENASICVTSLLGFKADEDYSRSSHNMNIEIKAEKDDIRLIQWLYNGELTTLYDDIICTGWVIHFIDYGNTADELASYLQHITVSDIFYPDYEVPRLYQWNLHDIKVKKDNELLTEFIFDPYL
ncbi:MAG: hypothetical protein JXQ23_12005 [Clostridia bacterium]|nr:hypothetical protein [Clostridia bacterium]